MTVYGAGIPFDERGGAVRGCLDLISGRFPGFVFGGPVDPSRILPVFHFHDVTREDLEPKLRHIAENQYATVRADEIGAYVRREIRFERPYVALCFDDAWASLWTVAAPLLKRFGLTAIAYAIPARIADAAACRPTIEDGNGGLNGSPFVTWPELRALQASGTVDVQCHTESHSMVFCSGEIRDFVTPSFAAIPLLNRPLLATTPERRFVMPHELGAPLYLTRSRMSDARRVLVPLEAHCRSVELVAREGGAAFFTRAGWQRTLRGVAEGSTGARPQPESDTEHRRAIEEELDRGRSILNDRLRTTSAEHVCLPWGVSGSRTTAALSRLGFRTAFANRLRGVHAVAPGDDPHWLKRLPNRYILRLPGHGRRRWL